MASWTGPGRTRGLVPPVERRLPGILLSPCLRDSVRETAAGLTPEGPHTEARRHGGGAGSRAERWRGTGNPAPADDHPQLRGRRAIWSAAGSDSATPLWKPDAARGDARATAYGLRSSNGGARLLPSCPAAAPYGSRPLGIGVGIGIDLPRPRPSSPSSGAPSSCEAGQTGRTRFHPQISPISADAGGRRSRGGRTTTKGAKGRRSGMSSLDRGPAARCMRFPVAAADRPPVYPSSELSSPWRLVSVRVSAPRENPFLPRDSRGQTGSTPRRPRGLASWTGPGRTRGLVPPVERRLPGILLSPCLRDSVRETAAGLTPEGPHTEARRHGGGAGSRAERWRGTGNPAPADDHPQLRGRRAIWSAAGSDSATPLWRESEGVKARFGHRWLDLAPAGGPWGGRPRAGRWTRRGGPG